jgi:hypothetical protein
MPEATIVLAVFAVGHAAGAASPPAYIDPGSGSLIIQAVAAGVVGAALTIRRVRETIADGLRGAANRVSGLVRREDRRR